MQTDPQITFIHLAATPSLEADVRHGLAELDRICDRITGCRAVITAPEGAHRHGRRFDARVEVDLPGRLIVASAARENAHLAVRDAFHSARRQLEDHLRRREDQHLRHATSVPR